jgi:hypothetical protein
MEPIVISGLDITQELINEFKTGWQLEAVQARARQLAAARARAGMGPARRTEVGRHKFMIDPHWYHYWGQREGYDIWKDPKEIERFARDTPEIAVEQERKALVNGWRGASGEGQGAEKGIASAAQGPRGAVAPRSSASALFAQSPGGDSL